MNSYNLLTENWIPVQKQGRFENISLKHLLCSNNENNDWQLSLTRDDMELAALQLIVCIVQVVFTPNDEDVLLDAYEHPMEEAVYDKGIKPFKDWFDLLHPKYPFMQTVSVCPKRSKKNNTYPDNWTSVHKLLMGLPEQTSKSPSSNAFFNTINESKRVMLNLATIALFQQASNGFSLGGVGYSVGLKGLIPITTLIQEQPIRKCIWCNILTRSFLEENGLIGNSVVENNPTWVVLPSFDKANPEHAFNIGLLRGLFWQPAKIKLFIEDNYVTGFLKDTGLCQVKGFWLHPHTPIDLIKFKKGESNKKPFLSAKKDLPLWEQMLSFFYTQQEEKEGFSRALVIAQYIRGIGRGKRINLAVGGYVQGKSTESLDGRRHEVYSLPAGWEQQISEIERLINIGTRVYKILDKAFCVFGRELKKDEKNKNESNLVKKQLKPKAKLIYFNNSEQIMHSILRKLEISDIKRYEKNFTNLAINVFEQVFFPYEHDPKFLKAIAKSRYVLNEKLKEI